MENLTHYSNDELSLRVFNDEALYKMRHLDSLKAALQQFKYTRKQLKVLVEELAEDRRT